MRNFATAFMFLALVLGYVFAPFMVIQAHHLTHNWRGKADIGVFGDEAMVVSAHGIASEIGRDILAKGGNAFDAAIAVNFALAVVYQQAGNIGGGGFMVFRLADGATGTLDFREKAPLGARPDMFLDENGKVVTGKSLNGHLSVGVPGTVAGMVAIYQRFGSLPWEALISPAIDLARDGFILSEKAAKMFNRYQKEFATYSRNASTVINAQGWQTGDTIQFEDLAKTLERIRDGGRQGFYQGETARLIIEEMAAGGGLITQNDLTEYRVMWRRPIKFTYRGYDIVSMPPPSSGGVALAQLLASVEAYDLSSLGHNSAAYMHLLIEAERRAYADRAVHLGDPDFVRVPIKKLTDPDYIKARMADFEPGHKTDSADIATGFAAAIESVETTHFSVADEKGNAVAITTTLNGNFGSKVIVQGAGFFLNNEMDDFSIKAGHANQFGLLGGHANSIAPAKRMLSSMTPTIISKNGDLFAIIGTPGGATIITSVFQSILNMIDFGMSAQEAVNARKFHSQWQPDIVLFEKGTPDIGDIVGLKRRGHRLVTWPHFKYELGRLEIIKRLDNGGFEGAADWTRGLDDRAVGF